MIVVSVKDWPSLFERCFQALRPGGFIELQDLQFPVKSEDGQDGAVSEFVEWSHFMIEAMLKFRLSPTVMDNFPNLLRDVGFSGEQTKEFRMLSGPWPHNAEEQKLGRMGLTNFTLGLRGFSSTLFTRALGWSAEQHEHYVQDVLRELHSGRFRTYLPLKGCVAQKPEGA